MTLREALDLLELNERTLEQSMLEASLQNRLEHTELRHVLRVFEAYRKVNAFLNPSFNTQGDARMTIIDESVPGGPMLEVTKTDVPVVAVASSGITPKNNDTFSDTMIETSAAWEATSSGMQSAVRPAVSSAASAPRGDGVNLFVMLGLIAAAFSVGVVVLGPTMALVLNRPVSSSAVPSVSSAVPSASSSPSVAPIVTAPPSATVVAPVVQPALVAPAVIAAQPVPPVADIKPVPPIAPVVKPVAPAITKPTTRPAVVAKPTVTTKPVAAIKPTVTSRPRVAAPRVTAPRVTTPRTTATIPRAATLRATVQPRLATRRVGTTPRVSSSSVGVAAPSRPRINQLQFSRWDKSGAVLRYRSWALVPVALRGLSPGAFKAAIFVARDPASLPDIAR